MDWWRLGRWALLVVAVVGGVLLMARVAVISFRYKGPTAAAAFTVATAADRKVDPPSSPGAALGLPRRSAVLNSAVLRFAAFPS